MKFRAQWRWITKLPTATAVTGMPFEARRFLRERQGPCAVSVIHQPGNSTAIWTTASGAEFRATVDMAAHSRPNWLRMRATTAHGVTHVFSRQKIEPEGALM